jgi:hypothetical protein
MDHSDREEDSSGDEETPRGGLDANNDMREPGNEAQKASRNSELKQLDILLFLYH